MRLFEYFYFSFSWDFSVSQHVRFSYAKTKLFQAINLPIMLVSQVSRLFLKATVYFIVVSAAGQFISYFKIGQHYIESCYKIIIILLIPCLRRRDTLLLPLLGHLLV